MRLWLRLHILNDRRVIHPRQNARRRAATERLQVRRRADVQVVRRQRAAAGQACRAVGAQVDIESKT